MRTALFWSVAAFVAAVGLSARPALAADPKDNTKEEAALQKRAEAFVEAFNKGDAKAVAAFWTPDGDYVDEDGHKYSGRKAIEEVFEKMFAATKGAKLYIKIGSVRFSRPDLAIEDGVTEVVPPDDGPPEAARYTIVHVKQDGQWYLDSVREAAAVPPSNYEHLEDLDWLVGDWADDVEKGEIAKASFEWDDHQNFLVSTFETTLKDVSVAGGTQWIGWDPTAKKIRSWSFTYNGGFGEGVWTKDGDKWKIATTHTMRDGKKLTATNIVTKVDADHMTFQSVERTVDGKELPDVKEVKMKRVK